MVLCRTLQVTRAAFYKWLKAGTSKTQTRQKQIVNEIKRIHSLPRHQDYGSPRIHRELLNQGTKCSVNTVAKWMRVEGIKARNKPKFKVNTTDSNHDLPVAPNRLDQQFTATKLNQVWLSDFTYIPTSEGFTYLCAVKDMCSRKIVGWSTSKKLDAQLALDALNQAIALRNPKPKLIIHSDRGSQYASQRFRKRIKQREFIQSMSRKGNCYDNAPMESFFKSFKVEEVYHAKYGTHEQATRAANDYIERFYNPQRIHSSVGYVSPNEFERRMSYHSCESNLPSSEPFVGRSHSPGDPRMATKMQITQLPLLVNSEQANQAFLTNP